MTDQVTQEVKPEDAITEEMILSEIKEDVKKDQILFLKLLEKKYSRSLEKKSQGNKYFSANEYKQALNAYREGLGIIGFEHFVDITNPVLRKDILDLFAKLLNNASQCYIALEKWDEALSMCSEVIKLDPNELKSYFRAGKCLKNLGRLQESFARLDEGSKLAQSRNLSLSPEYIAFKNEVAREINQVNLKQKEMYQCMFDKNGAQKKKELIVKQQKIEEQTNLSPVYFGLFSAMSGVLSYFVLQSTPPGRMLQEKQKIAISTAVGGVVGGIASTENKVCLGLSALGILSGVGFLAMKALK